MALWTGFVRDFTDSSIPGIEVYFHPEGPGLRPGGWDRLLVDKPVPVEWLNNSLFEVELEREQAYRMEFLWPDPDRSRVGQSWWTHAFRTPVGDEGGRIADIIGTPARNGRVRILQSAPGSIVSDQYVYDETTGDLYERIAR